MKTLRILGLCVLALTLALGLSACSKSESASASAAAPAGRLNCPEYESAPYFGWTSSTSVLIDTYS